MKEHLSHFASAALLIILLLLILCKEPQDLCGTEFFRVLLHLKYLPHKRPDIKDQLILCVWIPNIHLIYKFLKRAAN